MALMGLALLIAVSSLHVFGENRAVFWRESASGISVSAFFLAKAGEKMSRSPSIANFYRLLFWGRVPLLFS